MSASTVHPQTRANDPNLCLRVSYDAPDSMVTDSSEDFTMALFTRAGLVTETASVSGTVSLELDQQTHAVLSASRIEFDEQNVVVSTRPPISREHDYDEDDEP